MFKILKQSLSVSSYLRTSSPRRFWGELTMDVTKRWYYPLLKIVSRIICMIFGHYYPPGSMYCESCGRYFLKRANIKSFWLCTFTSIVIAAVLAVLVGLWYLGAF